jgi:EmrB/QacA subfamily drug resistance transporter
VSATSPEPAGAPAAPGSDDEPKSGTAPRSGKTPGHPGWTLALAAFGTFITALDVVVVSTALPTLRTHLHASLADLDWTINAYNLVFACFMLTAAALGDRFGRKRLYMVGMGVFTLASAAAAMSTTIGELIGARMVQGLGAAVVLPLTLTLVADVFPVEKRAVAFGALGGVTGLGIAAGPVVGGVIVQSSSWQWIFWANVPFGAAAIALSVFKLRESHGQRTHLDVPGLLLAGAGMFALTWGAVRAPTAGWGSAEVVGSLVAGAVLAGGFVQRERRAAHPMMPTGFFRNRSFSMANGVGFVQQVSIIGSLFIIMQLLQLGMGYRPLDAGVRVLAWNAMPVLVAPVAGVLAGRFGNRPVLLAGLALQGGGLTWLAAAATEGGGYGPLVLPLIVAGIGISLVFPVIAIAVTTAVGPEEVGIASGVNKAVMELGTVFGVSVISAVFAANGGYGSVHAFYSGFRPAMYVAAGVALAGLAFAGFLPGGAPQPPEPALAESPGEPEQVAAP